jgi:hypothetical protein
MRCRIQLLQSCAALLTVMLAVSCYASAAAANEPACPLDAGPMMVQPESFWLGAKLSIEEDTAAVLAHRGVVCPTQSSVFVLNRVEDQWIQTVELAPPGLYDPNADLNLDDGRLAVGWYGAEVNGVSNAGVVYIYELIDGVWTLEHEITKGGSSIIRYFGMSSYMSGDLLFVNARLPLSGGNVGVIVVFRYDGARWIEEQTLTEPGSVSGTAYGQDIEYADGQLYVGAPENSTGGVIGGRVYIYEHISDSWTIVQTLQGSELEDRDWFGLGIEVQGDTAAFAASGAEDTVGKVYMFQRTNGLWYETQIIDNPAPMWSPHGSDFFGRGLTFSGDTLVVGAPQYWASGSTVNDPGRAWIYRHDGVEWSLAAGLVPPTGHANDVYGMECVMDGEHLLVSAMFMDTTTDDAGAVYAYRLDDCDSNDAIDAIEICTDPVLDLDGDWVLDICAPLCPWDTAPEGGDGSVGLGDLNGLLSNWGPCPAPPDACPHDFAPEGGDGTVGLGDLNALLSNWGPCPG